MVATARPAAFMLTSVSLTTQPRSLRMPQRADDRDAPAYPDGTGTDLPDARKPRRGPTSAAGSSASVIPCPT